MPTPVGHTLAGCCLAAVALRRHPGVRPAVVLGALVGAANLPDIDFLGALVRPIGATLSHQGATHSLGFVLVVATVLAPIVLHGNWHVKSPYFPLCQRGIEGNLTRTGPGPDVIQRNLAFATAWLWAALAGVSHLFLDAVSFDGSAPYGIPLFWPFSAARWQAPLSLFPGTDRGDPLSLRNALELAAELAWMLPVLWLALRRRGAPAAPRSGR